MLPPELGQLTSLQTLYLEGNPLTMPPPEIVGRGVSAILDYLRGLQTANVERYEAKLVLVGEARMGKSSLLRALRGLPFEPSLSPTHGIDVATLQVPHPTILGEKLTLNMWDFGGQQIYQTSHQFFLTRRSIYLLVWDAAANSEASRISFWLDTITTLAPDARILLVATHIDEWSPMLYIDSYQRDYPQIAGSCEVSNKDGRGLDMLRAKIAEVAALNPFVGMSWPGSWIEVEKHLQARPEYRVDIATFLAICQQYAVEETVALETLGPYLHDLGKVLYFHDDPFLRTIMVLRPNWITKVIGRVLQDHTVQQAGGVLDVRDLPRIWNKDEQDRPYDPTLYQLFLRLMQRFDLCFALETNPPGRPSDRYLLPLLLPTQPPASLSALPITEREGQKLMKLYY